MTTSKLYIGNLPYSVTDDQLRDLFSQAGTVTTANVINDKFSGRSKGFGFVEMSSLEEAEKAIEMFNNHQLDGRSISVNEARPKEDRPKRPFRKFNNNRSSYDSYQSA